MPHRPASVAAFAARALILFGAFGLAHACVDDDAFVEPAPGQVAHRDGPDDPPTSQSFKIEGLPSIDAIQASEVFLQKLPTPTAAGENVAVHIKLPPPANAALNDSLVRIVGDPARPMVLFRSDTLVELGRLKHSPGAGFFTAFAALSDAELEQRAAVEAGLAGTKTASKQQIKFSGRTPIGITTGVPFAFDLFKGGDPVPLGPCPIQPLSEQARWDEALIVTDLHVVQDPQRTNDVCDPGPDNPDGVWTFKHLMTEMAANSGLSTHDFVVDWLSHWLTPEVINDDTLDARLNMYHRVIRPWVDLSGITSTLSPSGVLTLTGELDLDLAPFRLSAIVNRIDLGATASGSGGYGGASTSKPTTAGEMRFIFGVQDLDTCSVLAFSVILEYGVPVTGCGAVKDWANKWIALSDPALPRFGPAWRQQLADITESVVLAGAAPSRGNKSAINQVRTNENGLHLQWQFREFTLSTEDPATDIDTPTSGPLRAHTVAMTPDDTNYDEFSDPRLDDFVLFAPGLGAAAGVVRSTVSPAVGAVPSINPGRDVLTDCSASYTVPQQFNGESLRGGDAFTATSGPMAWRIAAADPGDLRDVCARQQFSLNTCNGCHFADTGTIFFHVHPQNSPAILSEFMTGGAGISTVPDAQWSALYDMQFRDLDRRHNRLYEIACAPCGAVFDLSDAVLQVFAEKIGVVPIDPLDPAIKHPPFKIGPVTKIEHVKLLLSATAELTKDNAQQLELGKLVRPRQTFVH